jgi:AraC-like DNA-binding protein
MDAMSQPDQLYRERRPSPDVAEHVACVWIQAVAHGAAAYTHRTIPNGAVELSCVVGGMPQLSGARLGPRVDVLGPGTTVVGVRFRPGGATPALRIPGEALVDRVVAADDVWGAAAAVLAERVATAASPWDAAAVLEAEVRARVAEAARPDPLVTEAVRRLLPWRETEVGSLTSALNISERQFRRRTREAIGLAPKTVHRILRFQGFIALAHGNQPHGYEQSGDGLALLAAEAGYADQSHLTRESLRLAGLTPLALLRETAAQCGPTHDHLPSFAPLLRAR